MNNFHQFSTKLETFWRRCHPGSTKNLHFIYCQFEMEIAIWQNTYLTKMSGTEDTSSTSSAKKHSSPMSPSKTQKLKTPFLPTFLQKLCTCTSGKLAGRSPYKYSNVIYRWWTEKIERFTLLIICWWECRWNAKLWRTMWRRKRRVFPMDYKLIWKKLRKFRQ